MRRSLARLPSCTVPIGGAATKHPFSTSSSGRGRGRGLSNDFLNSFTIAPGSKPDSSSSDQPPPAPPQPQPPLGHGRGKPLPSFSPFANSPPPVSAGRGRGSGQVFTPSAPPAKRISDSAPEVTPPPPSPPLANTRSNSQNPEETNLPSSILSVITGAGRGRPITPPEAVPDKGKQVENRHLRRPQQVQGASPRGGSPSPPRERLSQEEARKKAVGILSRGGDQGGAPAADGGVGGGGDARGGRGGFRGRGGRGRGMFGRGGRGRGGRGEGRGADRDDGKTTGLYLGDNADGEKLAKKLGPEMMNQLAEAFDEMSGDLLPCATEELYLDALHTNMMIECEPEYMMGEFDLNPDIDEKPPMPLREYLEKMKHFLMAYEGIETLEEWEEVVEETMKTVPLMKEIVDYYSGPDRITAKQQIEQLEKVAEKLPESAPASVKRYTERALLTLQSNPGWGFDKKYQFMDKLVREVQQQYK